MYRMCRPLGNGSMTAANRLGDQDDISRVLEALQWRDGHTSEVDLPTEEKLSQILATYVTPDLKNIARDLEVQRSNIPVLIQKGSPILLGGGGIVLKATNRRISTLSYAIKVQRPSLMRSEDAIEEGKRALAEYVHHAPLSHENIARLFAVFQIPILVNDKGEIESRAQSPAIIMEWVDNAKTLSDFILDDARDALRLCGILHQCFAGLEHLHSHNLIHWDIKGDNLLVDAKAGRVKLMDIGNARWNGGPRTDMIALTTEGNYPPRLRSLVDKRPRRAKNKTNRTRLNLDSPDWDDPWLDMWMLSRDVSKILGLRQKNEELPRQLQKLESEFKLQGNPRYLNEVFPIEDENAQFFLNYFRLILRRLLFPVDVHVDRYYRNAGGVVHDLSKLPPEFGDAQEVTELWAIPQNIVRVPVEKNVPLTRRVKAIISRAPFSRLKRHLQLATISEVYPGATHTRSEHSIGVYCVVCDFIKALYADRSSVFWRISIEKKDIDALLLASLIHDLGHIAYGHFLEEMSGLFRNLTHESYVAALLDPTQINADAKSQFAIFYECAARDRRLLEEIVSKNWAISRTEIPEFFSYAAKILAGQQAEFELSQQDLLLSHPLFDDRAELLSDPTAYLKVDILHSIISSAIDADKLDYLIRDGVHVGVDYPLGIDIERFFQAMTTLHHISRNSPLLNTTTPDRRLLQACIGVTEKGLLPVESILFARYQMFRSVYWHHTTRAHTAMLQFCVIEYLHARQNDIEPALDELVDVFRQKNDESSLEWLCRELKKTDRAIRRVVLDACEGLLGDRERAYKEALVLRYETYASEEAQQIHNSLRHRSLVLQKQADVTNFVLKGREFRMSLRDRLQSRLRDRVAVLDGELLVDVPPANRDQVYNVFVIEAGGPARVQDVSPMSLAISNTFLHWARSCRVFCSPGLLKRCERSRISREELSNMCWEALQEQLPLLTVAAE